MNEFPLILKLGIALAVGAIMGLERESKDALLKKRRESGNFMGIRTLSLITLLGAVAGYLKPFSISIFLSITVFLLILVLVYYVIHSMQTKDIGFTTELGLVFAYIIGLLITTNLLPMYVVIAVSVVIVLILSRKAEIRNIVIGIKKDEINAFISYALIALVVLPFLPNKGFAINEIPYLSKLLPVPEKFLDVELINPFKLWTVVALITGVDLAGYVLEKLIGERRGILIASVVGGLVSSTATTQSLAQESKSSGRSNSLVGSAIFANLASFFQLIILVVSINPEFLVKLTPFLSLLIVSSFIMGVVFLIRQDRREQKRHLHKKSSKNHKIFALGPALKFAVLFIFIRFISKISLEAFGDKGFLFTSAIAALTGLDAVTINTAELVKSKLSMDTGVLAMIVVNAINLLSKTIYSFIQGSRDFAIKFGISMAVIISASICSLLFV